MPAHLKVGGYIGHGRCIHRRAHPCNLYSSLGQQLVAPTQHVADFIGARIGWRLHFRWISPAGVSVIQLAAGTLIGTGNGDIVTLVVRALPLDVEIGSYIHRRWCLYCGLNRRYRDVGPPDHFSGVGVHIAQFVFAHIPRGHEFGGISFFRVGVVNL